MGWTDERISTLKMLWLDGLSATQIAKHLGGVTRNAVIGKVHRLGLTGRTQPSQPTRPAFKPQRAPKPERRLRPLVAKQHKPVRPVEQKPVQTASGKSSSGPPESAYVVEFSDAAVSPEKPGFATVLTIGVHMCKWPIGDPSSDDFTQCGRQVSPGRARNKPDYCDEHDRVAFQPVPKRSNRGRDGAADFARSLRGYF